MYICPIVPVFIADLTLLLPGITAYYRGIQRFASIECESAACGDSAPHVHY
jgi:hypothetical protein